jgi:hypothetical protein
VETPGECGVNVCGVDVGSVQWVWVCGVNVGVGVSVGVNERAYG